MRFLFLLAVVFAAVVADARPALQPVVKDYQETGEAFEVSSLKVFHQNQEQCAIAADETFVKGGKSVWDGKSCSAKGVYVAVADSEAGRRLVSEFRLDVPAKAQGYAIAAEDGRVAIVGRDPVGALYGAVTFAQMARGGTVEAARVRDWPDVAYRTFVSLGRGLWKFGHGEPAGARRRAAIKRGFDLMLRHKINLYGDFFWIEEGKTTPDDYAYFRDLVEYASARGILCYHYFGTALYLRQTAPKGMKFDDWPCVKNHYPWQDRYYCWSEDGLAEAAAQRAADHLERLGMDRCIVEIHPVDGGFWTDPETWSRRCAKCRARWKDDERWKASANQFNIWTRVLKSRVPQAVIGACIYPYKFNLLLTPEEKRTPLWRQNVTDYWAKLDGALDDPGFFYASWITTPDVIRTLRQIIPARPLAFSDSYPQPAGLYTTCHRKLGSSCEERCGSSIAITQGTDTYLRLETLIDANEHLWDLRAPGTETFDGHAYYEGPDDHVVRPGPQADALRRICLTFWGEDLAPYLQRVLASGAMPDYLRQPAATVNAWNNARRDPNYDPLHPEESRNAKNAKYPPLEDTPERMFDQVRATETCVRALKDAEAHLDGLDACRRRYFMGYAKYAPFWLAAARTRSVVRRANDFLSKGDLAGAQMALKEGRARVMADCDDAEETFRRLRGEPDTMTNPAFAGDPKRVWPLDRAWSVRELDRAEASANVTLRPRKIGRKVKLGIHRGSGDTCMKMYFDNFENVEAEFFDSLSLAALDRFDCVLLSARQYDKGEFFSNVKAYVEKGGGGVLLTGENCGNARFDLNTPFPEIVETAPRHVENFKREMKFADGRTGETMYVDYFALKPGPKGEVLAYGPDGRDVLAVRGESALGKVVFLGTFNEASFNGNDYATRVCPLFGANAEITRDAVEYFTDVRLKRKCQ